MPVEPAPARHLTLRVATAAGIVAVAIGALLLSTVDVTAFSAGRLAVRRAAVALVGRPADPVDGDVRLVVDAFAGAGLSSPGLAAFPRAGAGPGAARGARVGGLLRAVCPAGPVPVALGAVPPVLPADLVVFARDGDLHVALAVGESDALTVGGSGLVARVALRDLLGDALAVGPPAVADAVAVCSPDPTLMPDVGDTTVAPGRVAIGDASAAATHLGESAARPRDGDTSLWHAVAGGATSGLGWLLGHVAPLIGGVGELVDHGLGWLHDRLGFLEVLVLPILFAAWVGERTLTATADLRGLHAVLVWVVATGLMLTPMGVVAVIVAAMAGLVGIATGRWSPRDAAGLLTVAVWNLGVLLVDQLTGIDGTRPSSLGVVGFSLVTDVLIFAKPLAVAAGVARLARAADAGTEGFSAARTMGLVEGAGEGAIRSLESALGHVNKLKDLLQIQPSTGVDIAQGLHRGGSSAESVGGSLRHAGLRAGDLLSVALRGPLTAQSDALGVTAHLADALRLHLGTGRLVADEVARRLVLEAALPALSGVERAATLHGAASTVANALQGRGPVAWQPAAPAPPDRVPIRRIQGGVSHTGPGAGPV